jgi:hypothetical protein
LLLPPDQVTLVVQFILQVFHGDAHDFIVCAQLDHTTFQVRYIFRVLHINNSWQRINSLREGVDLLLTRGFRLSLKGVVPLLLIRLKERAKVLPMTEPPQGLDGRI